jgi:beta-lactamase class A
MNRQTIFALGAMLPGMRAARAAPAASPEAPLRRFRALPGTSSYVVQVGHGGAAERLAHRPNQQLFIASAYKTFVLGQYMRDVEAGGLGPGGAACSG